MGLSGSSFYAVQGGKESLSVAITHEFYIIDLMETHVKNLPQN